MIKLKREIIIFFGIIWINLCTSQKLRKLERRDTGGENRWDLIPSIPEVLNLNTAVLLGMLTIYCDR